MNARTLSETLGWTEAFFFFISYSKSNVFLLVICLSVHRKNMYCCCKTEGARAGYKSSTALVQLKGRVHMCSSSFFNKAHHKIRMKCLSSWCNLWEDTNIRGTVPIKTGILTLAWQRLRLSCSSTMPTESEPFFNLSPSLVLFPH